MHSVWLFSEPFTLLFSMLARLRGWGRCLCSSNAAHFTPMTAVSFPELVSNQYLKLFLFLTNGFQCRIRSSWKIPFYLYLSWESLRKVSFSSQIKSALTGCRFIHLLFPPNAIKIYNYLTNNTFNQRLIVLGMEEECCAGFRFKNFEISYVIKDVLG